MNKSSRGRELEFGLQEANCGRFIMSGFKLNADVFIREYKAVSHLSDMYSVIGKSMMKLSDNTVRGWI